jgi:hypothetical protein
VGRVNRFGGTADSPDRASEAGASSCSGSQLRGPVSQGADGRTPCSAWGCATAQPSLPDCAAQVGAVRGGPSGPSAASRAAAPLTARRAELHASRFPRTPCERPDSPNHQQRRASVERSSAHLTHGNSTSAPFWTCAPGAGIQCRLVLPRGGNREMSAAPNPQKLEPRGPTHQHTPS